MLTDALLQLSSAQAVAAASTVVSTNTIDLSVNRNIGPGEDLYAVFTCDALAGAATTFQVITSAAANLSSPTVLCSTASIPAASLPLGRHPICLCIPGQALTAQATGQRYLGVQYVTAAGTGSVFSAAITDSEVANNINYTSGFSVI